MPHGQPTPPAVAPARPRVRLQRIGLAPFVAVLYAYCAGGPFGFESMVSASGPGMSLLLILVVPWLFSVPISLATAEMASALPVEGGFYRWTRMAFGDFAGFLCGWWNWTGTFLMCGAYGVMLADYIAQLAPMRNSAQHWLIAFGFLLFVGWLNVRGIRLVGNLTLGLLLAALVPVVWFTARGFSLARGNPFHPFIAPGQPFHEVFGTGLALALWIYSGYEQLSTVAGAIEEPESNFPRALALTAPLAILTFLLPLAAGLAALGNWQSWQTGYIVTAARLMGGRALQWSMFSAAAVCTFVLLESTVLSATRLPFAMAEDGYLHPALARLHPRYRTPALAIAISVAVCTVLPVFSLPRLISVYAWLRVASSVLTLLSFWRLRQQAPQLPRPFRVPGGRAGLAAVVLLPIALFLWALINSDPAARWLGLLALASGPLAYAALPRRAASSGAILES